MTAAEALRRARATLACGDTPGHADGCAALDAVCEDRDLCGFQPAIVTFAWHRVEASALLDGFSVKSITEAGG